MIPAVSGYRVVATPTAMDAYVTGMLHCYALKTMLSAYTGPLIRVRRSSDDVEANISAVGGALDTATLLTFAGSGDAFISKWYDQRGNFDADQSTSTNQPKIVSAGSYLGAATFDGVDDYLRTHTTAVVALSFAMEAAMLTTPSSGSANYFGHPLLATTSNNGLTAQWQADDGYINVYNFSGSSSLSYLHANFNLNTNERNLWIMDRASYPPTLYTNGSANSVNSGTSGSVDSGPFTDQDLYIGTLHADSQFGNVAVKSFIVWTSNQSSNHSGIDAAM